jgi:hypothetical protein
MSGITTIAIIVIAFQELMVTTRAGRAMGKQAVSRIVLSLLISTLMHALALFMDLSIATANGDSKS